MTEHDFDLLNRQIGRLEGITAALGTEDSVGRYLIVVNDSLDEVLEELAKDLKKTN